MVKRISKQGENLAIIIDNPILDLLKIDETTKLKIKTDGKKIIIEPVEMKIKKETKKRKFKKALNKVMEKYDEDFKKLAKD